MTPKQLDALYKAFAWCNWIQSVPGYIVIHHDKTIVLDNVEYRLIAFMQHRIKSDYFMYFTCSLKESELEPYVLKISPKKSNAELFIHILKAITKVEGTVYEHHSKTSSI